MIYTITVIRYIHPTVTGQVLRTEKRVWGYFTSLEDAYVTVTMNDGDIFEDGYYEEAVIEAIPPGILPEITERWWYRYDKGTGKASRCEVPEHFTRIVGLAMG